jgi:hypothetical protein
MQTVMTPVAVLPLGDTQNLLNFEIFFNTGFVVSGRGGLFLDADTAMMIDIYSQSTLLQRSVESF